jgi:hypothetical protein
LESDIEDEPACGRAAPSTTEPRGISLGLNESVVEMVNRMRPRMAADRQVRELLDYISEAPPADRSVARRSPRGSTCAAATRLAMPPGATGPDARSCIALPCRRGHFPASWRSRLSGNHQWWPALIWSVRPHLSNLPSTARGYKCPCGRDLWDSVAELPPDNTLAADVRSTPNEKDMGDWATVHVTAPGPVRLALKVEVLDRVEG